MLDLKTYLVGYILGAILLFQGLHLFQESKAPLGTVPEEVQQATSPSRIWGAVLMVWAAFAMGACLLSHTVEGFRALVVPCNVLGACLLAVFGLWVVVMGRSIVFMGAPTVDDHGHGHH